MLGLITPKLQFYCASDNVVPTKAFRSDSGYDLRVNSDKPIVLYPGEIQKIRTGVYPILPHTPKAIQIICKKMFGCVPIVELQVRSKSGLASKGIIVVNQPGTIDNGYCGEIGVLLQNIGGGWYELQPYQKIAQAVLAVSLHYEPVVHSLTELTAVPGKVSERGSGGFGSTGVL